MPSGMHPLLQVACLTACRIVQAYSFLPGYNPYRDCLPVIITCLFFILEHSLFMFICAIRGLNLES
ncbi:MAG: hypothetical protein LBT76_05125, partial [Tannerella sp.]|nr:hypothetical protein [Tannerella sp.]